MTADGLINPPEVDHFLAVELDQILTVAITLAMYQRARASEATRCCPEMCLCRCSAEHFTDLSSVPQSVTVGNADVAVHG